MLVRRRICPGASSWHSRERKPSSLLIPGNFNSSGLKSSSGKLFAGTKIAS